MSPSFCASTDSRNRQDRVRAGAGRGPRPAVRPRLRGRRPGRAGGSPGSPDPLPTRHRDASCALRGLGPLLDRIGDNPLTVLGELDSRTSPRASPRTYRAASGCATPGRWTTCSRRRCPTESAVKGRSKSSGQPAGHDEHSSVGPRGFPRSMHTLTLAFFAADTEDPGDLVRGRDCRARHHRGSAAAGRRPVTNGLRGVAAGGATEDRSSLEMKHLYREDLRRLLVLEKPRAWPRGIRWIIEHAEIRPVGEYRSDEHRPTGTREQVT